MKSPPTAIAKTPCYKQTPNVRQTLLYMVTEEMDRFTYPTCSSNRLIFPQLRRENRLADLGLDQKGNFFKQLYGIIKNTQQQQQQHNPTTE